MPGREARSLPARRWRRRAARVATAIGLTVAAAAASSHASSTPGSQVARAGLKAPPCVVPGARRAPDCFEPRFPIRATFYYPWFPQAWSQQGLKLFTQYTPSLGTYSSSSRAVIEQHLRAMQYGGIQVGISSWWGQRAPSDRVLAQLLDEVNRSRSTFRWAVYYEPEGIGDPTVGRLVTDLRYVLRRYASNRAYLRVGSRFVVFVYADSSDGPAMAGRWAAANAAIGDKAYISLKVFPGYRLVGDPPQSWHQYAPDRAADDRAGSSFTISPGFYKANEASPRLTRDVTRWRQDVQDMVSSNAPWQIVTTFNEWGEGTAVESAQEWQTASGQGLYLDTLHAIRR